MKDFTKIYKFYKIGYMMKGQKKAELIHYLVLWAVLFAAPVVSMLVGDFFLVSSSDATGASVAAGSSDAIGSSVATATSVAAASAGSLTMDWQGVLNAWGLLAMFFVTFLIHNFFVAPLLVYKGKKWAYGIAAFSLVACFALYQFTCRPHQPQHNPENAPRPRMEQPQKHPEEMNGQMASHTQEGLGAGGNRKPHESPASMQPHEMAPPAGDFQGGMEPPSGKEPPSAKEPPAGKEPLNGKEPPRGNEPPAGKEPPRAFGGQDSVALIIMLLLLGLNVGVKYFFKSLDDKKRIKELERENLNRQLEYLKYQINPHFFMNTLNNIHALVDIDPEQAKHTIEVLSKLMRYVLYEGNHTMAPLQKELDFIGHYVALMRIRYTDKVRISVSLPSTATDEPTATDASSSSANLADILVPSLLFTTFVENAFKHGVSYQKDSFIEVSVSIDDASHEIAFSCSNSRKPEPEQGRSDGGVGLRNAKKRLQLIYGEDYDLRVESSEEEYRLLLRLPILTISRNDETVKR